MHKLKVLTILLILVMSLSLAGNVSASPLAATSPTLGLAGSYSVLAGQTVTNTGPTKMPGDLGVIPGSAIVGFPPGIIGPPGTKHAGDANAAGAMIDNFAAFDALDQECTTTYTGTQDLTTLTLGPGVYCADAFTLTGTLTLSGSGVWIFKSAATLITSGTANVVMEGDPCDVWWRVATSATLGVNTSLIGNILAHVSISMATGASLNGRALAQIGEVTMQSNTITGAICLAENASTATPIPTRTRTATKAPATERTATAAAAKKTAAADTKTAVALLPPAEQTAVKQTAVKQTAAAKPTAEQATETPVVPGLPGTGGGAPIRNEDFPWSLVMVGGLSAIAMVLGVRAFRRTHLPK